MKTTKNILLGIGFLCLAFNATGQMKDSVFVKRLVNQYAEKTDVSKRLAFNYYTDCDAKQPSEIKRGVYVKLGDKFYAEYLDSEVFSDGLNRIALDHNKQTVFVDTSKQAAPGLPMGAGNLGELMPQVSFITVDTSEHKFHLTLGFEAGMINKMVWVIDRQQLEIRSVTNHYKAQNEDQSPRCLQLELIHDPSTTKLLHDKEQLLTRQLTHLLDEGKLLAPYSNYQHFLF